ncbi:hypothetical protein ACIQC7_34950 [Kitasatospora sp. NPDC088556]|uniref:hypothetical protein n=1 Tax=Kitasatospora sp. NPDC088556 TaxID=3364076 RepID=UPI0038057335
MTRRRKPSEDDESPRPDQGDDGSSREPEPQDRGRRHEYLPLIIEVARFANALLRASGED